MPKESVIDQFYPSLTEKGEKSVDYPRLRATVSWAKDTANVQLAVINDDVEDVFSAESGLHMSLNREGINRLIRALRRARDQAYGADA